MKSLTKTFLYQMLNGSNKNLDKQLGSIKNPTYKLDIDSVQVEIDTIKRRFNYQMKNEVIECLEKGQINLAYNLDNLTIPEAIPVVGLVQNKKPIIYVNLTGKGRVTKDGIFSIDTRKLYSLLQTAYLLIQCSLKWNKISMNATVIKNGSEIYSNIFSKVLDKTNAINLDKLRSDKVRYLASKFYLINMMERDNNETTNNIAYRSCVNGSTAAIMYDSDIDFDDNAYDDFDKFILNLSHLDGLSDITIRSYMENFIKMYGSSTILALDYFPFFCNMIFGSMMNAHINNEGLIEPLIGKQTGLMYVELARILK